MTLCLILKNERAKNERQKYDRKKNLHFRKIKKSYNQPHTITLTDSVMENRKKVKIIRAKLPDRKKYKWNQY